MAGDVLSNLLFVIEEVLSKLPLLRKIDIRMLVQFYIHITPFDERISINIDSQVLGKIASLGGSLDVEFFSDVD